ncbi:type VII secretion target [Nocardia brasiliensis]|uniref:type VII secretion target n=1 Tax=Nocardia brasiliensis TaxID=37326 RepID=UPI002454C333|nr:type VII secretion target [Nocardia brasiliensis]
MVADKVEVDTNQLRRAAGDCDRIHDSISATLGTLRTTVAGSGTPWGKDSFGNKFAQGDKGYLAARENLLAAIDQMSTTFADYATGQRNAADQMDAMDAANAGR